MIIRASGFFHHNTSLLALIASNSVLCLISIILNYNFWVLDIPPCGESYEWKHADFNRCWLTRWSNESPVITDHKMIRSPHWPDTGMSTDCLVQTNADEHKSTFLPHDLNDTLLMRHCVSDCPEVWQRFGVIYDAPRRPHSTDLVYVLFTIYNMAIKNARGRAGGKTKKTKTRTRELPSSTLQPTAWCCSCPVKYSKALRL